MKCSIKNKLWDIISTEGALRLPTTYDNHPIPSHPSHPSTYIIEDDISRLINLSRPPMTKDEIRWQKDKKTERQKDRKTKRQNDNNIKIWKDKKRKRQKDEKTEKFEKLNCNDISISLNHILLLHSDHILTTLCLHSDYILIIFWSHSDYILTISDYGAGGKGGGLHELLIYCSRWSLIWNDL